MDLAGFCLLEKRYLPVALYILYEVVRMDMIYNAFPLLPSSRATGNIAYAGIKNFFDTQMATN